MLNYMTLRTVITLKEALMIQNRLAMKKDDGSISTASTTQFQRNGISTVSIWVDVEHLLEQGERTPCTLNASIFGRYFFTKKGFNANKLNASLKMINGLAIPDKQIEWNTHRMGFVLKIDMSQISTNPDLLLEYIDLLNKGYSLSGIHAEKTCDRKQKPTSISYDNRKSKLSLSIKADTSKNSLLLKLNIPQRKIYSYIKSKGEISSVKVDEIGHNAKSFEAFLWADYLAKISGTSDYYPYKKAEEMIEGSGKSKTVKNNLFAVINGVAQFKGVDQFLSHIGDSNPSYSFMKVLSSEKSAKKYIRMLDHELNVNPVTISRRDAVTLKADRLPNILSLINGDPYKDSVTTDIKENPLPQEYNSDMEFPPF